MYTPATVLTEQLYNLAERIAIEMRCLLKTVKGMQFNWDLKADRADLDKKVDKKDLASLNWAPTLSFDPTEYFKYLMEN